MWPRWLLRGHVGKWKVHVTLRSPDPLFLPAPRLTVKGPGIQGGLHVTVHLPLGSEQPRPQSLPLRPSPLLHPPDTAPPRSRRPGRRRVPPSEDTAPGEGESRPPSSLSDGLGATCPDGFLTQRGWFCRRKGERERTSGGWCSSSRNGPGLGLPG